MTHIVVNTPVDVEQNGKSKPARLDPRRYPRTELAPALGLRFAGLKLSEILQRPDGEKSAFFRALAFEISLNNVAVFPQQALRPAELEEVAAWLNLFSGAPQIGTFHIHPIQANFDTSRRGGHVFSIGGHSEAQLKAFRQATGSTRAPEAKWHSDVSFERRPPTYSLLQVRALPRTGGDSLFQSGYATYDKLTPPLQALLEGLTARHSGAAFRVFAERIGRPLNDGPRGALENTGTDLESQHPVIRTNPLTGLKALFVNAQFTEFIEELNYDESEFLLKYLFKLQTQSHDANVRIKWELGDLVIWDNRSTNHTATFDYGDAARIVDRVTVVGEIPFFDKRSSSKRDYDEAHPKRLDLPDIQL